MSFQKKLLMLFTCLLMTAILFTAGSHYFMKSELRRQAEISGLEMVNEMALSLEEYVDKIYSFVVTLESLVSEGCKNGENPSEILKKYYKSLKQYGVQTIFIGFENGMFFEAGDWTPPEHYDPKIRPWYYKTVVAQDIIITEPYMDMITNSFVISATSKLFVNGVFQGVVGLDINMDYLREKIKNKKIFSSGIPFLVDKKGWFIVSGDPSLSVLENINVVSYLVPQEMADAAKKFNTKNGFTTFKRGSNNTILFHAMVKDKFVFGFLFPETALNSMVWNISVLHIISGVVFICIVAILIAPLFFGVSVSLSKLASTVDKIMEKFSGDVDIYETATNVNILANEIEESAQKIQIEELKIFLASMHNALKTIGKQGEEIAVLTEEAFAIQDSLTEVNAELTKRQRIWKNTLEIMNTLSMSSEGQKNLYSIMETIQRSTGAFGVLVAELREDCLDLLAYAGYEDADLSCIQSVDAKKSIAGRSIRAGKAIWVDNVKNDSEYCCVHKDVFCEVEIPLIHNGIMAGVLEVAFAEEHKESLDMLDTLTPVASALAAFIALEKAHFEIKDSYRYLAQKFQSVTEIYHLESADHMDRIGAYSSFMAKYFGKTKEEQDDIEMFSRLHDIGKLKVPIYILAKPDRLSEAETAIIRNHPVWGAELIGNAEWLSTARKICLSHHERWDGSGYPYGLIGDEIPFEGQITALADVYDALRSERVYKEAFSHEKAVSIILNGDDRISPKHFNPKLLEFFKKHHMEMDEIFNALSKNR